MKQFNTAILEGGGGCSLMKAEALSGAKFLHVDGDHELFQLN